MSNLRGFFVSVSAIATIATLGAVAGRLTAPPSSGDRSASIAMRELESRLSVRITESEQKIRAAIPTGCPSPSLAAPVLTPTETEKVVANSLPTPEDENSESSESIAAFDNVRNLLDTALTRGSWGEASRNTFRNTLHSVSPARQQELVDSLVLAINSGRLVPTAIPPI